MDTPTAGLLAACLSACTFALANSLQHRVASTVPSGLSPLGMYRRLASEPIWILGTLCAAVAFLLHAGALRGAALIVVQPLMLAGCVLAVPVRAALDRRLPDRAELAAVVLTALGLVIFLVATDLSSTGHSARPSLVPFTLATAALAAVLVAAAARQHGKPAAALLGAASGLLFGLTAGYAKVIAHAWDSDAPLQSLATWPAVALVAAGLVGVTLNQRAYQLAQLSASLPVINAVDIAVAVAFGTIVFGEHIATSPAALAAQVIGLAGIIAGLNELGRRSPVETPAAVNALDCRAQRDPAPV